MTDDELRQEVETLQGRAGRAIEEAQSREAQARVLLSEASLLRAEATDLRKRADDIERILQPQSIQ